MQIFDFVHEILFLGLESYVLHDQVLEVTFEFRNFTVFANNVVAVQLGGLSTQHDFNLLDLQLELVEVLFDLVVFLLQLFTAVWHLPL